MFGDGIEEVDHPGCKDPEYRARRKYIGDVALNYKITDEKIPNIDYNENEKWVWNYCYTRLTESY